MKIFISWSGEESKQIALLLKAWFKKLLQATEPWMSDVDIEPGTRWSERISGELRESHFGIICVTQENRASEWIHFEAGALSMALNETDRKVVPLLIGFEERGDLHRGPLGLFNAVRFAEDDMWKLILTMNAELPVSLDGKDLRELFDVFWPRLTSEVEGLESVKSSPHPAKKSQPQLISEILNTVLDIQRKQTLEHRPAQQVSPSSRLVYGALADEAADIIAQESVQEQRRNLHRLTPRELSIARLAQSGLDNRRIAEALRVSIRTVEGHIYQIFRKLGVASVKDLADGGFDFTDGGDNPQK